MRIEELVQTDVPTLHQGRCLADVLQFLYARDHEFVIAIDGAGRPNGFLDRDRALSVIFQARESPENIRLLNAAGSPPITFSPSISGFQATNELIEAEERFGFVVDDLEFQGVVDLYELLQSQEYRVARTPD